MKLLIVKNRYWMMLASCATALLLSGCGQTGPLYMPDIPAAPSPSSAEINAGAVPVATPSHTDASVSHKK